LLNLVSTKSDQDQKSAIEYGARRVESGLEEALERNIHFAKTALTRVDTQLHSMEHTFVKAVDSGGEAIKFDGEHYMRLKTIRGGYEDVLAKYGIKDMAYSGLKFTAKRFMLPLEVGLAMKKVRDANDNDKVRVGFEQTGEVIGGEGGLLIGGIIGGSESIATLGLGVPIGFGITLFGAVTGAAAGHEIGDLVYEDYVDFKKYF